MQKNKQNESGFSVVELVIVMTVVVILSVMATMALRSPKLFEADTQALVISDTFQEARQRSLSQRTTMRVEINNTRQQIRIIDEGRLPLDTSDDRVIKTTNYMGNGVYIGTQATNQTGSPSELSPTPAIAFTNSVHPLSSGNSVATLRFLRNGTVTNAGNDAIGTGSVPTGATIYVWSKYPNDTSTNPTNGQIFRAVTVLSSSGLTRIWKCTATTGSCSNWTK
jgi:Tfp pilus assembly protein FimT